MRTGRRAFVAVAGLGVVAAAVFLVPTLWGKPWMIEHFYARVFLELPLDRPQLLSRLRILEPYGLDFHADDLDDHSVAFQRRTARKVSDSLETLRRYDRAGQAPRERLSGDVLEWYLETLERQEPFLFHDYPLNQLDGVQSSLPDFMVNIHQVNDRRDAEHYVTRLGKFGVAFDQVIEGLRHREAQGVVPPRFVIERVQAEVAEFTGRPVAEHVLQTSFAERLAALPELGGEDREALLAASRSALAEVVYPAYERVAAELARLHGVADEDDGVWRLPDGDAYYRWALRFHTTTELSADAIHELGLAEVARIQAEMRAILRAEGLPADDLAAALAHLGRDERFAHPDDEAGRAQVLADFEAIIADAEERSRALFGVAPRAPVVVKRIPAFKEEGAPGGYYNPPPFDGSRPGIFYANLRDLSELPRYRMRTLAYHEAVPGHHFQIAIQMEQEDLPFFRRVLPFTAFAEGWALYAERLAGEHGFHPTPYDQLGRLVDEVFRAVRLVVDTGIHARRWPRERAIDYMVANTGMPRSEVTTEVERYVVLPGQACAYKVGQLQLLAFRERAERALGDRFDLRAFHDLVLEGGSLPIAILERVIDDWVEARR